MALLRRTGTGWRSTIVLLSSMLLIFGLVGAAGAKPAPKVKVNVCHSASGTFHMINVSENALAAHLAHGDHLGTAGDCRTSSTKKVASGASTSTYSGGVLSVAFTAYQASNGDYSGTGTYSYTKNGRTYTFTVAHACMNKTTKTMTVWGPGTSNQTPYTGYGMLSLKDYGTTMGTRAAFGSTLASLPTTTQCSGSPLLPATGTGFLTFW